MGKHPDWVKATAGLVMLTTISLTLKAAPEPPIVVTSADELQAALVDGNAGRHILLAPGEYAVTGPLFVPEGVTLEGAGIMSGSELPGGFEPGSATRIVPLFPFNGDLLTLEDGVHLARLLIEHAQGIAGNAIAVRSREPGDSLSVSIEECEIINPNPLGITPAGPIGEGVLLITLNPNLGLDPLPHDGAAIDLRMDRSIIRANDGGGALFAINFSSSSLISATLMDNLVGGSLRLAGGVSRPDAVSGSTIVIQSQNNVYRREVPSGSQTGWQIYGGGSVPIPLPAAETRGNAVHFSSRGDRIEGFQIGIHAAAGVRQHALPGPVSDNTLDLKLLRLGIATPDDGQSTDLSLHGATSLPDLLPGNNNVTRVLMRQTTGSGYRNNVYTDVSGPLQPANQGIGNELVFTGNATALRSTNSAVLPEPETQYFINAE